jgi:ATP-dependent DNA helicase RecQ
LGNDVRSLIEIEADTGVRRGRLEALLKILAADGVVSKEGSAWQATGVPYVHDTTKWAALAQVRQQEAGIMRQYAHGQGCLMAYLQTALDDPSPAPCGRCSVCTGHLPYPGLNPTQDKLIAAREFLRGMDVDIEPRKRWPAGVGRKGTIRSFDVGRAVAFADDPAWVTELQAWRTSPQGEVPADLSAGAVALLARWAKTWPARPQSVVPMPSPNMSANRRVAEHIAQKGRLPLLEVFSWVSGPAPEDAASTPVVSHLESAIRLSPDAAFPVGPVLLVSTDVRTRWTATVAATLLREQGASQVLLLALHLRP